MWIAEARCVDPGCRCEDRLGVVLARCETRGEAVDEARRQCPAGYRWLVYFVRPPLGAGY